MLHVTIIGVLPFETLYRTVINTRHNSFNLLILSVCYGNRSVKAIMKKYTQSWMCLELVCTPLHTHTQCHTIPSLSCVGRKLLDSTAQKAACPIVQSCSTNNAGHNGWRHSTALFNPVKEF